MTKQIVEFIATWGYIGKAPKAPGTFGTLAAVPLAIGLLHFGDIFYMTFTLLFAAASIWVAQLYEVIFQSHDAKEVVVDEVAGTLVAFTALNSWPLFIAAFVLFRFFDILKPFPVGWADKNIKGGVGVVADDLLAGILTNMILQILIVQTPWF